MVNKLPQLTKADVRAYIYGAYFDRGVKYYHNENIFDTIRRGNQLKARCKGSAASPYRVQVTLGEKGIISDDCSCPIGGGCKHVAALLLTWVNHPTQFIEKDDIHTLLKKRSKDELITLIQAMIAREPDLETLLDLPTAGGDKDEPIDPEPYRRQVRNAFIGAHDWESSFGIAGEIGAVVDIAEQFAEAESWHNAATIFQTILKTGLENYENAIHDEGDILAELDRAAMGLAGCFETFPEDSIPRQTALRTLFDALTWDINMGGYGFGDEIPDVLANETTRAERDRVREWIFSVVSRLDSSKHSWRLESWGWVLKQLDARDDNLDEFLRRAEELRMPRLRFQTLTDLGRVEEAVQVARMDLSDSGYALLQSTLYLEQAGYVDAAIRMIEAELNTVDDERVFAWLAKHYEARGKTAPALELHLKRWAVRPDLDLYKTLEQLAKNTRTWETLRPKLLAGLSKQENWSVLTHIHLYEKNWDAAWETAEQGSQARWGWRPRLLEEVAQATEKYRPQKAIRVYLARAQQLIDQRGRGNYAEAARYLLKVRRLNQATHQMDAWERTIAGIREQNRNLPALRDELNKAGL